MKGRRSRRRPTTPRRSTRSPTTPRSRPAFPLPYFTSEIDHTRADHARDVQEAAAERERRRRVRGRGLFGRVADEVIRGSVRDHHAAASGRRGTRTRGSVRLSVASCFVCFPPDDAAALFPIDGEVETVQSAIDPLAPPEALRKQRRAYFEDARPVVFVVHPGEVVLCPRGWWHYARRARSQRDRDAELLQRQHERERARGDDHRQGAEDRRRVRGEEAAAAGRGEIVVVTIYERKYYCKCAHGSTSSVLPRDSAASRRQL